MSSGKGIPATPARTETVTTTTRTTTIRHGVETETITETITTYEDAHEDSQAANGPPAWCPMPNLTCGLPTTSLNPRIKVYAVPTPESLTPVDRQKLYLVTRGEGVGIFTSWLVIQRHGFVCVQVVWSKSRQDVLARINGLDGKGIYEIRHGWDDALEVYTIAFKEGTISVEPKPNGPFADTPYVWEPAPNPNAPCLGTHRYHIPAPGDLPYPRPFNTDRFYVVLKGEEVGIFGNWYSWLLGIVFSLNNNCLGIKLQFEFKTWGISLVKRPGSSATVGQTLFESTPLLLMKIVFKFHPSLVENSIFPWRILHITRVLSLYLINVVICALNLIYCCWRNGFRVIQGRTWTFVMCGSSVWPTGSGHQYS